MLSPVRWSNLKELRRSPAHYAYSLTAPRKETPAMRLGTAVHRLVLGGEALPVYDGTRRGKEWDAFKAQHDDGATIITADEAETAQNIADAVMANEHAARVLTGDHERRIQWEIAGRACVGTPDVIGVGFLSDLKTTVDSSPARLPFQARRMGYHAQLAWYRSGYGAFTGLDTSEFDLYVVAVESKPPHPVTVFQLTPSAIEMGERTWRSCFEQLLVCEASDSWPGYTSAIQPLDAIEDFQLTVDGEEVEL